MAHHIIDLDNRTDKVIKIVKAKYGLKDTSETISYIVNEYEESFLEHHMKPEFFHAKYHSTTTKKRKLSNFKNISRIGRKIDHT